jgi:hypothetical protein
MREYIDNHTLVKHEKESSKLRLSGGAWTINLDRVNLEDFADIRYHTEKNVYYIPKSIATYYGYVREFRGERKLVVPLKYWDKNALPF